MQTGKKSRFSKAALNTPSPPGVGVPPDLSDISDFLAILSDIREKLARNCLSDISMLCELDMAGECKAHTRRLPAVLSDIRDRLDLPAVAS